MSERVLLTVIAVGVYSCCSLAIALRSARRARGTSNDHFNATQSLPMWVAALSFLATNSTALEVLGLSGVSAHYGVQAFHFYWIGAIPALIAFSFVMIPTYAHSGARSIPDYLGRRFGTPVRLLNASTALLSTALYSGISLYGLAQLMHVTLEWPFALGIFIFSPIALAYVLVGGIRATIYNELLQFAFMLVGLLPLLYFTRRIHLVSLARNGQYWHLWSTMHFHSATDPVDTIGVVIGLGFCISFSYWCTDFLLIQRVLTARTLESARRVPLIAGFGKLMLSFVVVLPVLRMHSQLGHTFSLFDSALDDASPKLMLLLYQPVTLAIGIAGLAAGLLNSFANNLSAFSSLWIEDIYRSAIRKHLEESHYIVVGRIAAVACTSISMVAAYLTRRFEGLSQFVLLIFSLLVVPNFAVVLIAALSNRGTPARAFKAILAGIGIGAFAQVTFYLRWIAIGSQMNANFYTAIVSFTCTLAICLLPCGIRSEEISAIPHAGWNINANRSALIILYFLSALLLGLALIFNLVWW